MSVLVAAPGSLLHQFDSVAGCYFATLRVPVLGEADMFLGMGLNRTLDAIVENFPEEGR